jgi:thiol-disulfide isomerase/thioredoxin
MKSIFLFFIASVICLYSHSQNGQPAKGLFQDALSKAAKEHKNVFVIFTATWCGPCKYLKSGLHDVYNAGYFEKNYVILELYNHELWDKKAMENYGADSILASYKGDTTNVPYWLILNPNGKKLYEQLGFSNYPEELKKFIKALKLTSTLKDFELTMIYERFNQISRMVPKDE